MPWARLDDRYHDHKKTRRVLRREPAAGLLHVMAITFCNAHNTDGEIETERVDEWLSLMPHKGTQKQRVFKALFDLDLFKLKGGDPETLLVVDYLQWNRSRDERSALAEQGRRGGKAKAANGKPPDGPGSGPGLADAKPTLENGHSEIGKPPASDGSSTPIHATPRHAEKANTNAELRSAVIECFAYWQERCGHPNAAPSDDRLAKIQRRIRERAKLGGGIPRGIADVRLAIDGAARSPFIDDKGKKFDDIELICRTGSKLEDFMGRAALPPSTPALRVVGGKPSADDLIRKLEESEASA